MRIIHRLGLVVLLVALASCEDERSVDVINELPKGTLQGTVFLTSNDTSTYALDGVTVMLEGTPFTTKTDALGRWKMDNVPSRSYNIVFEKEGFGYTKLFSFSFLGGVPITVPQQVLFKQPACSPVFDNIIVNDSTVFTLNAHLPCANMFGTYYVAYYLSNNPNVSYEAGKNLFTTVAGAAGTGPASVAINTYYFQPGYPYGDSKLNLRDSIYAVAYAIGGYSGVTDPMTGEVIYSSLHPEASRRLAFKLPFAKK